MRKRRLSDRGNWLSKKPIHRDDMILVRIEIGDEELIARRGVYAVFGIVSTDERSDIISE